MKKADHKFYAEIFKGAFSVKRVLCEIYLPEKRDGNIEVKLFPTNKQEGKLDGLFEFSLRGNVRGFSDKVGTIVTANKVYSLKSSKVHWSTNIIDKKVVVCKPVDLKITRLFPQDPCRLLN